MMEGNVVTCSLCNKYLREFELQIVGKRVLTVCPDCKLGSSGYECPPSSKFEVGTCTDFECGCGCRCSFTCRHVGDKEWHRKAGEKARELYELSAQLIGTLIHEEDSEEEEDSTNPAEFTKEGQTFMLEIPEGYELVESTPPPEKKTPIDEFLEPIESPLLPDNLSYNELLASEVETDIKRHDRKREQTLLLHLLLMDDLIAYGSSTKNDEQLHIALRLAEAIDSKMHIDLIELCIKEKSDDFDGDCTFPSFEVPWSEGGYIGMEKLHGLPLNFFGRSAEFQKAAIFCLSRPSDVFLDWPAAPSDC